MIAPRRNAESVEDLATVSIPCQRSARLPGDGTGPHHIHGHQQARPGAGDGWYDGLRRADDRSELRDGRGQFQNAAVVATQRHAGLCVDRVIDGGVEPRARSTRATPGAPAATCLHAQAQPDKRATASGRGDIPSSALISASVRPKPVQI
jgi:hypothetical protein